ncbi:MAG: Uma2 family endonuclease [Cyanobacteria bacterium P01_B01_bin.77]
MPPPVLVVEVVSPGKVNRDRDYEEKRDQYEAREIPAYSLIDSEQQVVIVLTLKDGSYQDARFSGSDRSASTTFPDFALTTEQVLNPPD